MMHFAPTVLRAGAPGLRQRHFLPEPIDKVIVRCKLGTLALIV